MSLPLSYVPGPPLPRSWHAGVGDRAFRWLVIRPQWGHEGGALGMGLATSSEEMGEPVNRKGGPCEARRAGRQEPGSPRSRICGPLDLRLPNNQNREKETSTV